MKLDAHLATADPSAAAKIARAAERLGIDGLWTAETAHDPFLALAFAAAATSRLELGTAVTIAFARSPIVLAHTAWDLARLSGGRFILGLGTQVKAHVERRFAMPWTKPVPRMREYIHLVRAVWDTWQDERPLNFRGEHFTATLMTPFFNPGPIPHPRPPIYLAAVAPPLLRLTGENADGLVVHPLHTASYLREVIRPALAAGAARSGRDPAACVVSVPVLVITGRDAAERARRREETRARIAFYASTPSYRPVLEHHGWGETGELLTGLAARRAWDAMPGLISDEMLNTVAVDAPPAKVGSALRDRYAGLADRLTPSLELDPPRSLALWRSLRDALA